MGTRGLLLRNRVDRIMRGALRHQTPTPSRHGTQLQPVLLLSQILSYITDASLYTVRESQHLLKKYSQTLLHFSHINSLPSEPQNIRNCILARHPLPQKKDLLKIVIYCTLGI
jgi:hypothetical protein